MYMSCPLTVESANVIGRRSLHLHQAFLSHRDYRAMLNERQLLDYYDRSVGKEIYHRSSDDYSAWFLHPQGPTRKRDVGGSMADVKNDRLMFWNSIIISVRTMVTSMEVGVWVSANWAMAVAVNVMKEEENWGDDDLIVHWMRQRNLMKIPTDVKEMTDHACWHCSQRPRSQGEVPKMVIWYCRLFDEIYRPEGFSATIDDRLDCRQTNVYWTYHSFSPIVNEMSSVVRVVFVADLFSRITPKQVNQARRDFSFFSLLNDMIDIVVLANITHNEKKSIL